MSQTHPGFRIQMMNEEGEIKVFGMSGGISTEDAARNEFERQQSQGFMPAGRIMNIRIRTHLDPPKPDLAAISRGE